MRDLQTRLPSGPPEIPPLSLDRAVRALDAALRRRMLAFNACNYVVILRRLPSEGPGIIGDAMIDDGLEDSDLAVTINLNQADPS